MGLFWDYCGTVPGYYWDYCGNVFGNVVSFFFTFNSLFFVILFFVGNVLGLSQDCFGNDLGMKVGM